METVLHNSSWSIERHAACPAAYMQLLDDGNTETSSSRPSAPPLSNSIEAVAASFHQQQLSLAPLPPGWEVLADASGRPYYGNPTLRITQYEHPGAATGQSCGPYARQAQQPPVFQQPQHDAAGSGAVGALASPWQRCIDAYGRGYMLNMVTGETRWEYGS